jgi:hypothetical protein
LSRVICSVRSTPKVAPGFAFGFKFGFGIMAGSNIVLSAPGPMAELSVGDIAPPVAGVKPDAEACEVDEMDSGGGMGDPRL